MTRTQWMLAGALLAQILLIVLIAAPWSSEEGSSAARTLLPELATLDPSRIEISDGDKRLVLSRQADRWVVEQADGYPADGAKVDGLLANLRQLEVRRPVVTSSRYHDALKVSEEENERRLSIGDPGSGAADLVLFLGSSPNYGVNHVRRGDEDAVYEARGLSPWDISADPGSWIDKQLVDVAAKDVTSLKLSNSLGEIALTRQDGEWALEGGGDGPIELDAGKVDSFIGSIAGARFTEPAGRIDGGEDFGFESPVATLELVYDTDGQRSETFELIVGNEADEKTGSRYVHISGSEFGVILGKTYAQPLLEETVDKMRVESADGAGDEN